MHCYSARGCIAKLSDPLPDYVSWGLREIDEVVDSNWFEVASVIGKIEQLESSASFSDRKLAALVASKVHFHLENYDEALKYALRAGNLFKLDSESIYNQTMINKALDTYTAIQKYNADLKEENLKKATDPKLQSLVEIMFNDCITKKQYHIGIGYAIESHRLDLLRSLLKAASPEEQPNLLIYCTRNALEFVGNRKYRNELLRAIVDQYLASNRPDFINICQVLIYLEDAGTVAELLKERIKSQADSLQAYQIAFDLYECATQQFNNEVVRLLKPPVASAEDAAKSTTTTLDEAYAKRLISIISILSGNETVGLYSQFLIKNNKTDMLVLKSIKDSIRTNITHSAAVIANGFMHCGTTCDDFLRENLEWVSKASNWAKFTAVASLGVIHKGHEKESMKLLEPYLPKENNENTSGYVEGGSLYALGLIHANHGDQKTIDYLKDQLKLSSVNIKHGACLGLGLAALGTHKQDVYDALKACLYQDDAILGEAAGLAMGLVMLGSKFGEAAKDMTTYVTETQHEKIRRGLCLGISLLNYGRLEEATALIESLIASKDANLRRSAVYSLAMAYCGTGNADVIRRLLQTSASDVNFDVRRAAVSCIGFVLCNDADHCISFVKMFADSFSPHVRYGAAMALGIACAGSSNKEAIAIVEPLLKDVEGYVRQGALIALAMILMQHNEVTSSKVKDFRANLIKIVGEKQEDNMTKFGAVLAHGILDAAGRNVSLNLCTKNGHINTAAVVGMLIFQQYWFWFPLSHFLSLAFKPTCLVALNGDLKMPKLEFRSDSKPSTYAYPPALQEKKEKLAEKVESAILSITAKQKKKEQQKQDTKMEVDVPTTSKKVETPEEKPAATFVEPEPNFNMLQNPARVLNQQLKVISLATNDRYQAIKDVKHGGIVILMDKNPALPAELVELARGGGVVSLDDEKMANIPEPFEY